MNQNPGPPPGPTGARRRWRPWRLVLGLLLGAYFIAGAAFLTVRYWVWPRLDAWRPRIELELGRALGEPVHLGRFETDFDRFRPRLFIDGVRIGGADGQGGLSLRRVEALLSWRSVLAGAPVFASLRVVEPKLDVVRASPTRFLVSGVEVDLGARSGAAGLGNWLLSQHAVRIERASVSYRDARSGQSARLEDVDVALGVSARRHRVSVTGRGLPAAGQDGAALGRFELIGDLYRLSYGGPGDLRAWGGKVFVSVDAFDAGALQALADRRSVVEAGKGGIRLWVDFDGGRPLDARCELDVAGLGVRTADGLASFDSVRAALKANWRADGSVALVAERLALVDRAGVSIATGDGPQRLVFDRDTRLTQARISLASAPVGELLAFARAMPLPATLQQRIARWRVDGRVDRAVVDWQGPDEAPKYAIDVDFSDFSFDLSGRGLTVEVPGFRRISGKARLDADGGELNLAGSGATLHLPGIFEQPDVALEHYDGRIRWHRGGGGADALRVDVDRFEFANPDAAGSIEGHWQATGQGAGEIDLAGRLTRARADRVWRYLPSELPGQVRSWVQRAVVAGRADDVRLVLRGRLEDFPFRKPDSGEFLVDAHLLDGRLDFAPGWPAIDAIDARLRFERGGMQIQADSARSLGVGLTRVGARIDDFRTPVVRIDGHGEGPAQDMLRYVDESPVGRGVSARLGQVRVGGTARLDLGLELPLEALEQARVDGSLQLGGNRVALAPEMPAFEAVTGKIAFTRDGLRVDALRADWLGGSLSVSGGGDAWSAMQFKARGHASAEGLRPLVGDLLGRRLSGRLDYDAQLRVRDRAPALAIDGQLERLDIALPAPLAKPAGQPQPFSVRVEPVADPAGREAGLRVRAQLGRRLGLEFVRGPSAADGAPGPLRGAVAIGVAPVLPASGVALQMRVADLDLDQWRSLSDGGPPGGAADWGPDRVTLVADHARVGGKDIDALVLGATRIGERWLANVRASQLDGSFEWQPGGPGDALGKLSARFSRLEVPETRADPLTSLLEQGPRELPALDVRAERFVLGKRVLGRLELVARPGTGDRARDWVIERLHLAQPGGEFDATGRWAAATEAAGAAGATPRTTTLDFRLKVADAGQLLGALGFPNTVRGGTGSFDGGISWRGPPTALDLSTLSGELRLDIGQGQFLRTDPGIAKLIGVLNLQSLPRRLSLDFRDVFAKGFAFDQIRGNAAVLRGVARTEDLQMSGVQARVGIRGQVDLNRETQSLRVDVRPQVDAGLATLAYAAMINPAIGLGSFVAQMLLQKPLNELFAYEFRIEGDWKDPVVEQKSRRPLVPENPETLILQ